MKQDKKNQTRPQKSVKKPTDQRQQNKEWFKATKFTEYDEKDEEFRKADPDDKKYNQVVDFIDELKAQDEWFAENTPYQFKVYHWPRIELLATIICLHLQALARKDNQYAIRTLAQITVKMTETLTEILTCESEAAKKNRELIQELKCKGLWHPRNKIETNAELMQDTASELPYWPMLRFKNSSANSEKQFQRIATELKLGAECPMPYVKSKFPDLREVPELRAYKTGSAGKSYAPVRKAVIQSLKQLARKA